MTSTQRHTDTPGRRNWSRVNQWLLWLGLAGAVALLYFGHGAHLLQLAPFLILLACPLMHVFGHGGHGGHGSHASHTHRPQEEPEDRNEPAQPGPGGGHVH